MRAFPMRRPSIWRRGYLRTQDDKLIMLEPFFPQWTVYRRSIRANCGTGLNISMCELHERVDGRCCNAAQPNAPESLGFDCGLIDQDLRVPGQDHAC